MCLMMNTFLIVCTDDSRDTIKCIDTNSVKNISPDKSNTIKNPDNNQDFNETGPSQLEGSNCK